MDIKKVLEELNKKYPRGEYYFNVKNNELYLCDKRYGYYKNGIEFFPKSGGTEYFSSQLVHERVVFDKVKLDLSRFAKEIEVFKKAKLNMPLFVQEFIQKSEKIGIDGGPYNIIDFQIDRSFIKDGMLFLRNEYLGNIIFSEEELKGHGDNIQMHYCIEDGILKLYKPLREKKYPV